MSDIKKVKRYPLWAEGRWKISTRKKNKRVDKRDLERDWDAEERWSMRTYRNIREKRVMVVLMLKGDS